MPYIEDYHFGGCEKCGRYRLLEGNDKCISCNGQTLTARQRRSMR